MLRKRIEILVQFFDILANFLFIQLFLYILLLNGKFGHLLLHLCDRKLALGPRYRIFLRL